MKRFLQIEEKNYQKTISRGLNYFVYLSCSYSYSEEFYINKNKKKERKKNQDIVINEEQNEDEERNLICFWHVYKSEVAMYSERNRCPNIFLWCSKRTVDPKELMKVSIILKNRECQVDYTEEVGAELLRMRMSRILASLRHRSLEPWDGKDASSGLQGTCN